MRKLIILLVTSIIILAGLLTGCTNTTDDTNLKTNDIYPKKIDVAALESPIHKYFTTKKITWSFDDYYMEDDYPPNKGFDGLSKQINEHGGYVNILVIFATPWILANFSNEFRNYSVVKEFYPIYSNFSQTNINKSLEFFNNSHIFMTCHEWNHSESEHMNDINLSQANKTVYFALWNMYNNYHIKPHFWLGRSSWGNYNITLALKSFSEKYWPVYAEGFSNIDEGGHFPDGNTPAVEYIGSSCDPGFGWDWGLCKLLPEAQKLYGDFNISHEVIFMRCHPALFKDPGHENELKLWQDYIDWIYKHNLININHTQAIEYKVDRDKFTVIINNENKSNYTIDLSKCQFNHAVLFSPPDTNQWKLSNETGNVIIGNDTWYGNKAMGNNTWFFLEKGHKYYYTISS